MTLPVLTLRVRIFLFFALLIAAIPTLIGAAMWLAHQAEPGSNSRILTTYTGVAALILMLLTVLIWQLFDRHIAAALQSLAREMQTTLHADKLCIPDPEPLRYLGPVSSAAEELTTALHSLRQQHSNSVPSHSKIEARQMAAILRDLQTGVLVMNRQHQVLLYNQRAFSILSAPGSPGSEVMGLARPVFELFDGSTLKHLVEQLTSNENKEQSSVPLILSPRHRSRLLEGTLGMVRDEDGNPNGYVLVFEDATDRLAKANEREQLARFALEGAKKTITELLNIANETSPSISDSACGYIRALDEHLRVVSNRYAEIANSESPTMATCVSGDFKFPDKQPSPQPEELLHDSAKTANALPSRPEFYDFDLFNRPVATELKDRALKDIDYVVFDTETTGLNPSKGDEIISIGAVRIVNGRVLSGECFNELINPGRRVPASSTVFHGLVDADLVNKPPISEVLPRFARFVGDSVLIAHNAAFDMKFIALKSDQCGVHLDNPILDTVLLSAWLHDHTHQHTLDDLALRFGISIEDKDRHTALGDAMATALVFLKLLKQLESRGICTLSETIATSDKMTHIKRQQKTY